MQRLTTPHPTTRSADLVAANVAQLKALFPEAFAEGRIDFEVLRQLLGEVVDDGEEKYGLHWPGKRRARRLALTPSAGTLRPCPEESVAWETTRNLMIEGDNLEVLKLLQKSYAGKVKLIYIDPPYNTGKDFIYPDNYQDGVKNYLEITGQVDSAGAQLSSNPDSSGRFHTNWLNMMYPRLKAAHHLLKEDGVLMMSIDDGEVNLLKCLAAEIWGEENFLAVLIWDKRHSQQQGIFKKYHEYVLVYAKNKDRTPAIAGGGGVIDAGALKRISRGNPASDFTFPPGVRFQAPEGTEIAGKWGGAEEVEVVGGRFICQEGKTAREVTLRAGWTQRKQMESYFAGKETYDTRGQQVLEFYFNRTGKLKCRKARRTITPSSILPAYGMVSQQTRELAELLGAEVFSRPKPVNMLKDFVQWFCQEEDIVLDFFAGSGTLGHAVISCNAQDNGNRRHIQIQLPEPLRAANRDQRTAVAYLDAIGKPHSIAEIAKERLRRGGRQIKKAYPETSTDLGFRVFKLDSSNFKAWEPRPTDLAQLFLDHVDPIKEGRGAQDILYELLLKRGLDLCSRMETRACGGQLVYAVDEGALMVCLAPHIACAEVEALASGIADWRDELDHTTDVTVVFLDSAFADDVAKTNCTEILRQHGIQHVQSL